MMKIIKFEADYCSPCSMVSDFLDKNKIEYERYNISSHVEQFAKFQIKSVPTIISLNEKGEEINRIIGFKPEEILKIVQ